MEEELQHLSHQHPLILLKEVKDVGEVIVCEVCWQNISGGSAYSCENCFFFLHKLCAELPIEMKHPWHSENSLTLRQSPDDTAYCYVCKKGIAEKHFTYNCSHCDFDVDIGCAVRAQHFSYKHPLILIEEEKNDDGEAIVCMVCLQKIAGSAYRCTTCSSYLHKLCAELPAEMEHPGHSEHPLTLQQSLYYIRCCVCHEKEHGFVYTCSPCDFAVDIRCAIKAQHFSHEHPLILLLIEEQNDDGEAIVCIVCLQKITGSAYRCTTCSSYLHKLCAELPAEMKHPWHSEHPLALQELLLGGCCYVCEENIPQKHFSYSCSPCDFDVDIRCAIKAQHFSHEHPLILIEEKNDDGERASCDACLELITGSIYRCTNCSFDLHKFCSELLAEIKHPMHPEHLLTLLTCTTFKCNACHIKYSKAITYHCFLCNFYLDISCAVRAQSVKHGSHEHPLSPVHSPASFECHACRTKCEGFSYMCNTCSFWIHEECASLPKTFKHYSHVHHLTLIYSIHEDFDSIWNNCRICDEQLLSGSFWFYACKGCQYCIHVNCSTKTRDKIIAIEDENLHGTNLIHLPMPDESVNLIDEFLKKISLGNNKRKAKVNHFSHKHPLILFDAQADNDLCSANELLILNEQQNEKICKACARQILAPFYSCNLCDFFLHTWCAELPNELQHPSRPQQLILLEEPPKPRGLFVCVGCKNCCNGFTFSCVKDNFMNYCLKCASLPNGVIHEVHEHPLLLKEDCINEGCAACDQSIKILSFGCNICNFSLHYTCALLPRTIKHRYDKHPFTLIDAPIEDGPDEYICEFCEKEIDPTWWFYHCIDCDKLACAKCIYKAEKEFPSIKWGSAYNSDNEPHPLVVVQAIENNGYCDSNSCLSFFVFSSYGVAFKCELCDIMLHTYCRHPM